MLIAGIRYHSIVRGPANHLAAYVLLVSAVLAQGPKFPSYPPSADADPSVRHEVVVPMPTRLRVERTPDRISVGFDITSVQSVRITVGKLMTIGVKYERRVYAAGDPRPVDAEAIGYSSIEEPVNPSNAGFLNGRSFLNRIQGGIPVPGRTYTVEEDVSIFETDIPSQRMWSPVSKKYRVPWENKLVYVSAGE